MKQGARPVVTVTGGEHCTLIGAGVLPLLLLLQLQLLLQLLQLLLQLQRQQPPVSTEVSS